MEKTKKGKVFWMQRITLNQSVLITIGYFITLIACIIYTDRVMEPKTNTLTIVQSGTHGNTASISYGFLNAKGISRFVLPLFGSVTGKIELRGLGVPGNTRDLNIEVSYYVDNAGKWLANAPVGLRLGKDNYVKDFWYYWTLYSAVSMNMFFIICTLLFCCIGITCKTEGATGKKVVIYQIFCLLYLFFWGLVL